MATHFDDTAVKWTSLDAQKSSLGNEPTKRMQLRITTDDLDAAATTDTVDFADSLPAKSILMGVSYDIDVLLDGPAVTAATLSLGDGSDADRFLEAVDVLDGSGSAGFNKADPSDPDGDAAADTYPLALSSATTLRATVTLTNENAEDVTDFDMTLWVHYFCPTDPRA